MKLMSLYVIDHLLCATTVSKHALSMRTNLFSPHHLEKLA